MPTARGLARASAVVVALLGLLVIPAAASAATPAEIFADFARHNGQITGDYSFDDLKRALEIARQDELYGNFAAAVDAELDAALLGRSPGDGAGLETGGAPAASPLPEPRSPDESGDPPWPFIALTALGGALVVLGAGSSIYRRARR